MPAGLGFWHVKRSGLCLSDRELSVMVFQDMLQEQNTEDRYQQYLLAPSPSGNCNLASEDARPSQSPLWLPKSLSATALHC